MAVKTSEYVGIVVGHTARVFSPRKTHITKVSAKVIEAFLGGYVQVWVEDRLAFVQCPINTACVVLHNNRNPTLDEVQDVIRAGVNAYPVGSELEVVRKEFIKHSGKAGDPFYVVKNKPPVNQLPFKKRPKKEHEQLHVEPAAEPDLTTVMADALRAPSSDSAD